MTHTLAPRPGPDVARLAERLGGCAEPLLSRLAATSPAFFAALRDFGDLTVGQFLDRQWAPPRVAGGAGTEEVAAVIGELLAPRYGRATAVRAEAELVRDPVVATSNHAGLDTMADSFHGTMLHAVRGRRRNSDRRTAVVLTCNSVSLDNLTFPMGLLYYEPSEVGVTVRRMALLPSRQGHRMVSAAPAITADQVARVRRRIAASAPGGDLLPTSRQALERALDEDVDTPEIWALDSFAEQSALINSRLWGRCAPPSLPILVHVELERVAAAMLERDLRNPESVMYRLLFDPEARAGLLGRLDGAPACWRAAALARGDGGGGTQLFWAVSPKGRRVPLVVQSGGAVPRLVEALAGHDRMWDLVPTALADALAEGALVPALLTCFATVSFAHGLACVGGYYQASYLPTMYMAVHDALDSCGGATDLRAVPSDLYIAGIQGVLGGRSGQGLVPIGPIDLGARGGLTDSDLECITGMSMVQAQLASLVEVLPDLLSAKELSPSDVAMVRDLVTEHGPHLIYR